MDTQKGKSTVEAVADVTRPEEEIVSSPDDNEASITSIFNSIIADIQRGQATAATVEAEEHPANLSEVVGFSNAPVASGSAGLMELMDIDEFFGEPICEINQDGDVIDLDSDEKG